MNTNAYDDIYNKICNISDQNDVVKRWISTTEFTDTKRNNDDSHIDDIYTIASEMVNIVGSEIFKTQFNKIISEIILLLLESEVKFQKHMSPATILTIHEKIKWIALHMAIKYAPENVDKIMDICSEKIIFSEDASGANSYMVSACNVNVMEKLIVRFGAAQLYIPNTHGIAPIDILTINNGIIDLFERKKINKIHTTINQTNLFNVFHYIAISPASIKTLDYLIANNMVHQDMLEQKDTEGNTPLRVAHLYGNINIVQKFLSTKLYNKPHVTQFILDNLKQNHIILLIELLKNETLTVENLSHGNALSCVCANTYDFFSNFINSKLMTYSAICLIIIYVVRCDRSFELLLNSQHVEIILKLLDTAVVKIIEPTNILRLLDSQYARYIIKHNIFDNFLSNKMISANSAEQIGKIIEHKNIPKEMITNKLVFHIYDNFPQLLSSLEKKGISISIVDYVDELVSSKSYSTIYNILKYDAKIINRNVITKILCIADDIKISRYVMQQMIEQDLLDQNIVGRLLTTHSMYKFLDPFDIATYNTLLKKFCKYIPIEILYTMHDSISEAELIMILNERPDYKYDKLVGIYNDTARHKINYMTLQMFEYILNHDSANQIHYDYMTTLCQYPPSADYLGKIINHKFFNTSQTILYKTYTSKNLSLLQSCCGCGIGIDKIMNHPNMSSGMLMHADSSLNTILDTLHSSNKSIYPIISSVHFSDELVYISSTFIGSINYEQLNNMLDYMKTPKTLVRITIRKIVSDMTKITDIVELLYKYDCVSVIRDVQREIFEKYKDEDVLYVLQNIPDVCVNIDDKTLNIMISRELRCSVSYACGFLSDISLTQHIYGIIKSSDMFSIFSEYFGSDVISGAIMDVINTGVYTDKFIKNILLHDFKLVENVITHILNTSPMSIIKFMTRDMEGANSLLNAGYLENISDYEYIKLPETAQYVLEYIQNPQKVASILYRMITSGAKIYDMNMTKKYTSDLKNIMIHEKKMPKTDILLIYNILDKEILIHNECNMIFECEDVGILRQMSGLICDELLIFKNKYNQTLLHKYSKHKNCIKNIKIKNTDNYLTNDDYKLSAIDYMIMYDNISDLVSVLQVCYNEDVLKKRDNHNEMVITRLCKKYRHVLDLIDIKCVDMTELDVDGNNIPSQLALYAPDKLGHINLTDELVYHKNLKNHDIIHILIMNGNVSELKKLVNKYGNNSSEYMTFSCRYNHYAVELFMEKITDYKECYADIEVDGCVVSANYLCVACRYNPSCVRYLMNNCPDVNYSLSETIKINCNNNNNNNTDTMFNAFRIAIQYEPEAVQYIVSHCTDINKLISDTSELCNRSCIIEALYKQPPSFLKLKFNPKIHIESTLSTDMDNIMTYEYSGRSIDDKLLKYKVIPCDSGENVCSICVSNVASIMLYPCGHKFCPLCVLRVSKCPPCRTDISGTLHVHGFF